MNVRLFLAVALCAPLLTAMPAAAQTGYSTDVTVRAGTHTMEARGFESQGVDCSLLDFEGIGNLVPIGTIPGTPNTIFGTSWLGAIDTDAGGTGNFANEPTPDTTAAYLDDLDNSINFDAGVQFVEVFYSADASSIPMTLTAYDGPSGTGNVVDTVVGNTVGTASDGADCTGDPSGNWCLWDSVQLTSATNNIMSVTLTGAVANRFGFDNMTFCTGVPSTGACCSDAGCTVTTEENCDSLLGTYYGDDSTCDPDPCDTPPVPTMSKGMLVLAGGVLMLLLALALWRRGKVLSA